MQRGQESRDAVKVRTLPVQVAALLTHRIVTGELEDGRAPSELDIAQEFGVSRVVAREPLCVTSVFGGFFSPLDSGVESAMNFSRFSRTWIMCGQRWSSW